MKKNRTEREERRKKGVLSYEEMIAMSRPKSGHMQMDRKNRAKQFAPFDALRGFGEAIREKGVLYTDRPALCEDRKEELDRILTRLHWGDRVTIIYFKEAPQVSPRGLFETVTGDAVLTEAGRSLWIWDTEIPIRDIVDITVL